MSPWNCSLCSAWLLQDDSRWSAVPLWMSASQLSLKRQILNDVPWASRKEKKKKRLNNVSHAAPLPVAAAAIPPPSHLPLTVQISQRRQHDIKGNLAVSGSINIPSPAPSQVMREQLPSQEVGRGWGGGRKTLLYESFADHRLPFMQFDCGDEKQLVLMMQRAKNWSGEG